MFDIIHCHYLVNVRLCKVTAIGPAQYRTKRSGFVIADSR